MTTISPITVALKGALKRHATGFGNPVQLAQEPLRFAGDAFEIRKKLLAEKAESPQAVPSPELTQAEREFKAIGDTVVWQRGDDTLRVVDMIVDLCTKRPGYRGHGTVETLAKDFAGMDVKALQQGFDALHHAFQEIYLGKDYAINAFWLRPSGEKMIEKLYPGITLPPKADRFTIDLQRLKRFKV